MTESEKIPIHTLKYFKFGDMSSEQMALENGSGKADIQCSDSCAA